MEERSLDFFRSELVAVFLRELEYFQGVLMLTTNRVKRFDKALQSRIHLALKFKELDEDARLCVWRTSLPLSCGIGPDDVERLAKRPANGREVSSHVI